jgi:hypothetical protein
MNKAEEAKAYLSEPDFDALIDTLEKEIKLHKKVNKDEIIDAQVYDDMLTTIHFINNRHKPFNYLRSEDEIGEAENEMFDRVWYVRSFVSKFKELNDGVKTEEEISKEVRKHRLMKKNEDKYGESILKPVYDSWEYGFISGKLSALRWVTGDDWDFLDT